VFFDFRIYLAFRAKMPSALKTILQAIPLTSFLEAFKKVYQQNLSIESAYMVQLTITIIGLCYFFLAYCAIFLKIYSTKGRYMTNFLGIFRQKYKVDK
jgi:ABC-type polysaccharide/polyol phosphate export permease